jgi:cell division protein FtsB
MALGSRKAAGRIRRPWERAQQRASVVAGQRLVWLLSTLFFIVAPRRKSRVINMLENNLSQLEELVSALVQENKALQEANQQIRAELAQLKDENDALQMSALEQEELHSATAARIQALVELASRSAQAAPSAAHA